MNTHFVASCYSCIVFDVYTFFQNAESLIVPLLSEKLIGAAIELVAYLKGLLNHYSIYPISCLAILILNKNVKEGGSCLSYGVCDISENYCGRGERERSRRFLGITLF